MKKLKSVLITILALLVVSCVLMVGCNNKGGGGGSDVGKETYEVQIRFNRNSVIVPLNSEEPLIVYVLNTSEKPVFTSADENVATVADNGVVKGIGLGETTITATVAGKSATCLVMVEGASFVPVISFSDEKATVAVGTTYKVSATITSNSMPVEGATINYSSEDESIATIDQNGVITGVSKGSTFINARANYNGEELLVTMLVEVNSQATFVINEENINIVVNGALKDEPDSVQLTYTALVGNTAASVDSIVWSSSDESVATVSDSGLVQSVSAGQAVITATTSIGGAELWSKTTINVGKTYIPNALELDELDMGQSVIRIPLSSLGLASYSGDIQVRQNGKKLYSAKAGSNLGIFPKADQVNAPGSVDMTDGQTSLDIELDDRILGANVFVWTMIIDTPEEVHSFSANGRNAQNRAVSYYGYYKLGKDIDMLGSEKVVAPSHTNKDVSDMGRNPNEGFQGYFDGQGYAIKNATFDVGGLFGVVGKDGVIKNLAIYHATLEPYASVGAGFISQMFFGTIEDCYISGTVVGPYSAMGGIAYVTTMGKVKNVVIQISNKSTRPVSQGLPCSGIFAWLNNAVVDIENVYVITDILDSNGEPHVFGSGSNGGANDYKATTPGGEMVYNGLTASFWDVPADKSYAKFVQLPLDVAYNSEYYLQQTDGTYTLKETISSLGGVGDTINIAHRSYDGYTHGYDETQDNVFSATITEGTVTTLKVYYLAYDRAVIKDESGNDSGLRFSYYDSTTKDASIKNGGPVSVKGNYFDKQDAYKIVMQSSEWYNRLMINTADNVGGREASKLAIEKGYKTFSFKVYVETMPTNLYLTLYYGEVYENNASPTGTTYLSKDAASYNEIATKYGHTNKFLTIKNASGSEVSAITAGAWYTVTVDISSMNYQGSSLNSLCLLSTRGSTIYIADLTVSTTAFNG